MSNFLNACRFCYSEDCMGTCKEGPTVYSELALLRNLAEQLRYYARHGIVDASKEINEDLYNWLQEYEKIRKE